jgi:hypothetical protein
MTDQQSFDEDPQLRALLAQSDPARSLPPADPTGLARLLEDTMSTDLETRVDQPVRQRSPLTWLAAAAAVAVIGGGGAFAAMSMGGDDDPVQQAGPASSSEPAVITLDAAGTGEARCAVPTPEILSSAEVAFAGTVTAVDGDTVTLTPTETFTGQAADEVELVGLMPGIRGPELIGIPAFEVGSTYLVSGTDGQVSACGFSGPVSPELEQLYDVAFR